MKKYFTFSLDLKYADSVLGDERPELAGGERVASAPQRGSADGAKWSDEQGESTCNSHRPPDSPRIVLKWLRSLLFMYSEFPLKLSCSYFCWSNSYGLSIFWNPVLTFICTGFCWLSQGGRNARQCCVSGIYTLGSCSVGYTSQSCLTGRPTPMISRLPYAASTRFYHVFF